VLNLVETVINDLPEDTTLDVVENLITEGEACRAQQVLLIETQTRGGQEVTEARQQLVNIEDTLTALYRRRAYLKTMEAPP